MGRITIGRNDSEESQIIYPKSTEVIKVERYDDNEIRMQLSDIIKVQNKLENKIKLLKLFIPITLIISVIGLFF